MKSDKKQKQVELNSKCPQQGKSIKQLRLKDQSSEGKKKVHFTIAKSAINSLY
jgi:hypothetical protein